MIAFMILIYIPKIRLSSVQEKKRKIKKIVLQTFMLATLKLDNSDTIIKANSLNEKYKSMYGVYTYDMGN